ncbi:MAG: hypothetical protein NVS2B16_06010 [Chloroflexota bacterium]
MGTTASEPAKATATITRLIISFLSFLPSYFNVSDPGSFSFRVLTLLERHLNALLEVATERAALGGPPPWPGAL